MSEKVIQLDDYGTEEKIIPITERELEQWIKEGYPISGGGGIPSDYQTPSNKLEKGHK